MNGLDTISLARLLGKEGDLPRDRYQEPTLEQTKRGVWFIRPWVDVVRNGRIGRAKKTITIGTMGKREAAAKAREIMAGINRADYIITSQINFGKFLEEWDRLHVERQAKSTQAKYRAHVKNHIRPAFGKLMMCEVTTLLVQQWMDSLGGADADCSHGLQGAPQKSAQKGRISWATKTDIRNILSSIFTCAIKWGRWKDSNPIEHVHAGRCQPVREQRKLTDDEMRRLMAALPEDVRLLCYTCLFTTMRISEALGLQEKHLDFEKGQIHIRQRFYRGDLDFTKTRAGKRDIPMGYLGEDLKRACTGDPEKFVFKIKTHRNYKSKETFCHDDRDIHQHFLRPMAKALGIYWEGFGFHSFRREAITMLAPLLGQNAIMRMAGHTKPGMSLLYTLADHEREDKAIRQWQETILGKTGDKVQ